MSDVSPFVVVVVVFMILLLVEIFSTMVFLRKQKRNFSSYTQSQQKKYLCEKKTFKLKVFILTLMGGIMPRFVFKDFDF